MRLNIGIIGGTGKEGRALAFRWARAGHDVYVGSREPSRGEETAASIVAETGQVVHGGGNAEAAAFGAVVVLCVPYSAHAATLSGLAGPLQGRILVDITVPLQPPRVREVHLPAGGSAAQEAQALVGPGVRVVSTLHHVSSVILGDPDGTMDIDVLVCGDDADARAQVCGLVADLGLSVLDGGVLRNAVALEALTPVLLHLNRRYPGSHAGIRVTGLAGRVG